MEEINNFGRDLFFPTWSRLRQRSAQDLDKQEKRS